MALSGTQTLRDIVSEVHMLMLCRAASRIEMSHWAFIAGMETKDRGILLEALDAIQVDADFVLRKLEELG